MFNWNSKNCLKYLVSANQKYLYHLKVLLNHFFLLQNENRKWNGNKAIDIRSSLDEQLLLQFENLKLLNWPIYNLKILIKRLYTKLSIYFLENCAVVPTGIVFLNIWWNTMEKFLTCVFCSKMFRVENNLKRHVETYTIYLKIHEFLRDFF